MGLRNLVLSVNSFFRGSRIPEGDLEAIISIHPDSKTKQQALDILVKQYVSSGNYYALASLSRRFSTSMDEKGEVSLKISEDDLFEAGLIHLDKAERRGNYNDFIFIKDNEDLPDKLREYAKTNLPRIVRKYISHLLSDDPNNIRSDAYAPLLTIWNYSSLPEDLRQEAYDALVSKLDIIYSNSLKIKAYSSIGSIIENQDIPVEIRVSIGQRYIPVLEQNSDFYHLSHLKVPDELITLVESAKVTVVQQLAKLMV